MPDDLAAHEWRVGGHGDCGILALVGYDRDLDPVLGLMNTAVLAAAVVDEHNAAIRFASRDAPSQDAEEVTSGRDVFALANEDAEDVEPRLGSLRGPAPG